MLKARSSIISSLFMTHIPIRDDALCNLTDKDEEQDEGEQPAKVVTRKVKPGAVVDVDL